MKAQSMLLWFLLLGYITFTMAESTSLQPSLNNTIQSGAEPELIANDTSTAEQILDYLIENNSAVNFALKRGNNKRKQQQNDDKRDSNGNPLSLDGQINDRISSYLNKKSDKLKNVTALETRINETLNELSVKVKENSLHVTVEKATPSLPPFFSNAYNRVVHLLGNNRTEGGSLTNDMPPKPPKKPTEEEILAMVQIDKQKFEITSKPLILEETINEIGSQLIGKLSTKKEETTATSTLPSTTSKTELISNKISLISASTTLRVPVTTVKSEVTSTTPRNTIQKLGDRVGGLLERLGINKGKTDIPSLTNNRYTYTYEVPTTPTPVSITTAAPTTTQRPAISSIINNILPNNVIKEETVESINNVQSFLQQFGVTINSFGESTTLSNPVEMNDEENMRLPTTFRTTRRPYPWTTNRIRPSNDVPTVPSDFEEMETTTRRFFPTSFWRKTTTTTVCNTDFLHITLIIII